MEAFILQIKENIDYQEQKLAHLWKARGKTNLLFLEQSANHTLDPENTAINQALTDSLLGAMASLVDYYCMYCFLKLGVKAEKITKVQYRQLNNQALLSAAAGKPASLDIFRKKFDEKITDISNKTLSEISPNDYWPALFSEAITSAISVAGIAACSEFSHGENGFLIDSTVRKFHEYMYRFYCNEFFSYGVKYNLFIDINNCLKHNIVPYVTPKLEDFEGEARAYSYVEFKKDAAIFLKPGLLKTLVDYDFDAMQEGLKQVYHGATKHRSDLERSWGMSDILRVDKRNGYLSQDKNTLYFFIDNVLIAKTRDASYVDVGISLKKTLNRLLDDIRYGMNLDMSEFDS
ncbi:MAG: hypothetical protein KJ884_07255 [Gammaproteobacteria bacterium]|nr:hypothetical protein [Gammaproteobacteria bacterium]MBU1489572.1 hypothetical protein [Gammaproteobacteria bacterium]MBU2067809.1 hypothetical protein [Gammaproteobacteria bacterium]MBU2140992.1 hypothetical protein [Gammaproteobacteria bacterium]MBU2217377.1 hypothetical protein [Gammaproteobacteria bacterium]